MSTIFVTNNSNIELSDGFSGVPYLFEPDTTVEIPIEAARHIFGYEDQNKIPYLVRLGWIKSMNDKKQGIEILAKWELSDRAPVKNQPVSPLVERVPLASVKRSGGKILQVA